MDVKVILYTPDWHERLLSFMVAEYPSRSSSYLNWWLTNLDNGDQENWNKTIILVMEDKIVGCTTANGMKMLINGREKHVFWRGNTIISNTFRGKGFGKILYKEIDQSTSWFSTGITDVAWEIQPKIMSKFVKLAPVNVYISLNRYILNTTLNKIGFLKFSSKENYPDTFKLGKKEQFVKISDFEKVDMPENGYWMGDGVEFVRDRDFLQKRFVDIYRSQEYHMYTYQVDGKCEGYLVVRKAYLHGIEMLSLVDLRCKQLKWEKRIRLAAVRLARLNKIGIVITLTSRKYSLTAVCPLTFKMSKELHTASGDPGMIENTGLLITSADSDLDFVYYK